MTKRFKCKVKKINHVAGDFIHSHLISFLECSPSIVNIHISLYMLTRSGNIYHTVTFSYSFSMYFFSAVTLKIRSRSRKFYQLSLSCSDVASM